MKLFNLYHIQYLQWAVQHKMQQRSRLRHCATCRKVAGSIPDGFTGIFHWHNPSSSTMVLGLTKPLTEMCTRNISWGKGGRCVGLTTLPPSCAECLEIWEPQPPGTLRACNWIALVQPKTLKWSNITTTGMKNIFLRSAILKQISKGILQCKPGRAVQMTFSSKRNYQEVIKELCSLPCELPIPIVRSFWTRTRQ